VLHLSRFARRVTLVVRGGSLEAGMSDYLVQQIRRTPNVEVWLRSEVVDAEGGHRLERISVRDGVTGAERVVPARMLFVLIGALPHTDWLAGVVQRDPRGYVATGPDVDPGGWTVVRPPLRHETSMPGVFAAGDVRLGSLQRVAAAVGEGSVVVQHVHQYLEWEAAAGERSRRKGASDGEEARA
jgi:thioredoxin reductase (NADPH)